MTTLEKKISTLPHELNREVEDFVEFLIEKRLKRPKGRPTFSWAGSLKELRDEYTSVELQHKVLQWRTEDK